MAKQAQKKEPKKQVSKLHWSQNVHIIGYGNVFAGDEVQPEQEKALKELGLEATRYAK